MLSLRRPTPADIDAHLASQRGRALSYPDAGASREERAPAGFVVDHNRQLLGHGEPTFERARHAIRAWAMFPAPLAQIQPAHAPIEVGTEVAVIVYAFGMWFLNAARIVYVIDEPRRFGFAYGTLPGHAESGEERFLVEQRDDDSVWYDLRAFSRPRWYPARVARPLVRSLQHRFGRMSKAAMLASVNLAPS